MASEEEEISPNPWYVLVFHGAVAAHYAFALYYDWVYVDIPESVTPIVRAFGYKLKFYTNWNAIVQLCYFTLSSYIDYYVGISDRKEERGFLVKTKDYLEASIAFPVALFVSLTYWGLAAIDKQVVIPKEILRYFPMWLIIVFHTNVAVCQLLEMTNSKKIYPKRSNCLIGLMIYNTLYVVWLHIVHNQSDLWAYPIIEELTGLQRFMFFLAGYGFSVLLYLFGEKLHALSGGRQWSNRSGRTIIRRPTRFLDDRAQQV